MDRDPPAQPRINIEVLDRESAEFEELARLLFEFLEQALGEGFAKWAASTERGRFLVYAPVDGWEIEDMLSFARDENELLGILKAHKRRLPPGVVDVDLGVPRNPALRLAIIEALA